MNLGVAQIHFAVLYFVSAEKEVLKNLLRTPQAGIAQLVEQRTENPRVTSSNLVPGISENPNIPLLYTGYGRPTEPVLSALVW